MSDNKTTSETKGVSPLNGVGKSGNQSGSPSLETLIAKYGDSSNTTWVEDKFQIWRHGKTGAAIGYLLSQDHCIIWGNPLCEIEQYSEVARDFLTWCTEEKGWKPIWTCTNEHLEKILANDLGWRAVFCVQEDALDPTKSNPEENKEVRKHIRGAEKKGCKIIEEPEEPSAEIKAEIEAAISEWKDNRSGTQVHTTNVEPWRDPEHRKYFYARDANGKVVGFLFLAQVNDGWAIKDCISTPDAPKNITEWLITSAIHSLANENNTYLTFGPTPAEALEAADNLSNGTVRWLSATYSGIEKAFLGKKRDFRRKFQVDGEPLYICFPENGLGISGISALMKVLTD